MSRTAASGMARYMLALLVVSVAAAGCSGSDAESSASTKSGDRPTTSTSTSTTTTTSTSTSLPPEVSTTAPPPTIAGPAAEMVDPPPPESPPAPVPSVTLRWGSPRSVGGCPTNCLSMVVDVSGFAPTTELAVQCEFRESAVGDWNADFGFTPPPLQTDTSGAAGTGDNGGECIGSPSGDWTYRVVVNGVASGEIG